MPNRTSKKEARSIWGQWLCPSPAIAPIRATNKRMLRVCAASPSPDFHAHHTFSRICPFVRCLIHAAFSGISCFSSPLLPRRNLCANIINKSSITLDTRFGFAGAGGLDEARRPFWLGLPNRCELFKKLLFRPKINARISVCGPPLLLLLLCRLSTCHTHRQQLFEHRGCWQQGDEKGQDKGGLEAVKPDPTAETVTSPSGVNVFGLDEILGHALYNW